jgi:sugar/nucleoside kinase (ribokinase family)
MLVGTVSAAAGAPALSVGIIVADLVVPPLRRLPAAGELVATDDFLVQPGGCAANSAIALRRLGVSVAVCGRVGDDPFGDFLEADLAARGIDTSLVARTVGYPTSKTVIIPVVGRDRRFIHTFGANAAVTAGDIASTPLEAARVVYVGGYLVLPSLRQEELAERFGHAREHGTAIVLDVVVPVGQEPSLDDVRDLLPLVDYFVPNEDEARVLTGEADPLRQAERILECGAHTVMIKMGERGVLVRTVAETFKLPAPPVEVVEPSGAGDAFAAGLILGILEGWSLERQVRFASVLGGSACTALGCWAGVFTRDEAEAFLEANGQQLQAVPL